MSESVPAKLVAQTWSRPFAPPESIPASADVVIIGGGIVGVSTAWFLTKQGVDVVLTVRSDEKVDFVRSVGADRVIVTSKEDFVAVAKEETGGQGVDVVIDGIGGEVFTKGIDALRAEGVIVPFGFVAGAEVTMNLIPLFFAQKQIRGAVAGGKEDLAWGLDLVQAGKVRPLLQETFPLSQVSQAHRLVAENKNILGNLVLLPWE